MEDTPLRPTLGCSATSTLRRKPIPSINPSSTRIKNSQLVSRSQSLQASQLTSTPNTKLDKRAITVKRQGTITNTRSAFYLAKGKDSCSAVRQEPVAHRSSNISSQANSPQLSQATDTNDNTIQFDSPPRTKSPTSLLGIFNAPATPSAPWSPSALRTLFSSPPMSKYIEPLHLLDISSSSTSRCIDTTSTHIETSAEDQSTVQLNRSSNPVSFGDLFDVDKDNCSTKAADLDIALGADNSFELSDVAVRSHLPQLGDVLDQNAITITPCNDGTGAKDFEGDDAFKDFGSEAGKCSVELSDESGFEAVLSCPAIYAEAKNFDAIYDATKIDKGGGSDHPSQNAVNSEDSEDEESTNADPSSIKELGKAIKMSVASPTFNGISSPDALGTLSPATTSISIESIKTDTNGSDTETSIGLYSTPIKAQPSDTSSVPDHVQPTTPLSIFPASLFPRLFAELTTTYSHLGFAAHSAGMNVPRVDPQASRTQTELAGLRAGTGSVLARARAFGQTLWSPSRVQISSASDAKLNTNILEGRATLEISKSGCVGTPPASPTVSAVMRDVMERSDSLHSVAISQRFRMARSFDLE